MAPWIYLAKQGHKRHHLEARHNGTAKRSRRASQPNTRLGCLDYGEECVAGLSNRNSQDPGA